MLDPLFGFYYTSPGAASFFGYFSDRCNPTLPNIEATFEQFPSPFRPFFMHLLSSVIELHVAAEPPWLLT